MSSKMQVLSLGPACFSRPFTLPPLVCSSATWTFILIHQVEFMAILRLSVLYSLYVCPESWLPRGLSVSFLIKWKPPLDRLCAFCFSGCLSTVPGIFSSTCFFPITPPNCVLKARARFTIGVSEAFLGFCKAKNMCSVAFVLRICHLEKDHQALKKQVGNTLGLQVSWSLLNSAITAPKPHGQYRNEGT